MEKKPSQVIRDVFRTISTSKNPSGSLLGSKLWKRMNRYLDPYDRHPFFASLSSGTEILTLQTINAALTDNTFHPVDKNGAIKQSVINKRIKRGITLLEKVISNKQVMERFDSGKYESPFHSNDKLTTLSATITQLGEEAKQVLRFMDIIAKS